MRPTALVVVGSLLVLSPTSLAAEDGSERGTVRFEPRGDQREVPERYRLDPHTFDYEMTPKLRLPGGGPRVLHVRFPSPVKSPHPENNTVHCEYYLPNGKGPFPGVVVLDITGGDQSLSRTISTHLAQRGVAALFMQMAYYGPRRPAGSRLRLLSTDYRHTTAAVRQTVLDVRRAAAWLESRQEVDPKRLGVLGTSLGSFLGTLAAEMEPRVSRVVILLGGGGLVEGFYDHPQAKSVVELWELLGGTKEKLARLIAPYDPLTYAANLKDRRVLMICGSRDEIVPPKMAKAMWQATGEQKIVWFDCTHYGAALYFAPALKHVVEHLTAE